LKRLYRDANEIIVRSIAANLPHQAVNNALAGRGFSRRLHLLAIGKAAWSMALAAYEELGGRIESGIWLSN
jgi:hydroxypyruvate reductase